MSALRLSYRGAENRSPRFINLLLCVSVVQRTSSLISRLHRFPQLYPFLPHLSYHLYTTLLLGHREAPAPELTSHPVPCRYQSLSRTGLYTGGVVDPLTDVEEFLKHPLQQPPRISTSFVTNQELGRLLPWEHRALTFLQESGMGGG